MGHARRWEEVQIDGDPVAGDAALRFVEGGSTRAYVTVGRDLDNLKMEARLEAAASAHSGREGAR